MCVASFSRTFAQGHKHSHSMHFPEEGIDDYQVRMDGLHNICRTKRMKGYHLLINVISNRD
jgi:hypothetical protein